MEPRGIRNNNPGNINRTTDHWIGESRDQSSDPRFVVFDLPEWGIRALARVLRMRFNVGADTVRKLIAAWAPPSENDTEAYVQAVAAQMGIDPDAPITSIDDVLHSIVPAIIQHENGEQPYAPELLAQGIQAEKHL